MEEQDNNLVDNIIKIDFEAEANEQRDLALRCRAELDNYRKRVQKEKEEIVRYAGLGIIENMLPVVDNFEFGLEAFKTTTDINSLEVGMRMIYRQLNDFLVTQEVSVIDAKPGDLFDPKIHEAVSQEESESISEGYIKRQVRRGYSMRGRLIRPGSVIVSKGAGDGGDQSIEG